MPAACALGMISGKIIFYFEIAERLRTLRYLIFTGGRKGKRHWQRLLPAEAAALRGSLSLPLAGKPSQSSLRDASSPEGGAFMNLPVSTNKAPPSGELDATSGSGLRGLAPSPRELSKPIGFD